MDDTDAEPVAQVGEVAAPPAPTRSDLIVDRWFGDHAIPNHYANAREELKRRLNEEI